MMTLPYFTTMSNSATCFCFYCTPRYQVSIYRTIGPLGCFCFNNHGHTKNSLTLCNVFISHVCFILCFHSCCGPNNTVLSEGVQKYGGNAVYAPTPSPTHSPSPCPTHTLPEHEPFPTSLPYLGPILRQCQIRKNLFLYL